MESKTVKVLERLAPRLSAEQRLFYAALIDRAMTEFGISSPTEQAAFLAQLCHESTGLTRFEENLNYSVEALLSLFSQSRLSEADARRFGRSSARPADQQGIANAIYGGAWGRKNLGNTEPGDGWRFRGRGPIQLTGRANYRAFGKILGLDLEASPTALLDPSVGLRAAAAFWQERGCGKVAGDVVAVTEKINGGSVGLKERKALFAQAQEAMV